MSRCPLRWWVLVVRVRRRCRCSTRQVRIRGFCVRPARTLIPRRSRRLLVARRRSRGVWTHLVGLYDPGADGAAQLRLYVNGVLAGSAAVSAVWTAGGGVRVGGDLQAGRMCVAVAGKCG
ncbi:LamG-like jellyroll fold domain-containing protein [Fodinicola feengrottensis]|uniref:LamG-like jellyroll fold domain-containing protein n=1 Tax=Fodinicola feengrottensis TaxID=435914 RepID=UPI002441179B|nr:LamG-like jellyroll fold domain-containing protein [Fodinicola feengrottensis]